MPWVFQVLVFRSGVFWCFELACWTLWFHSCKCWFETCLARQTELCGRCRGRRTHWTCLIWDYLHSNKSELDFRHNAVTVFVWRLFVFVVSLILMVIFYVAVDQYPCINMQLWDENLFASYFCYQGCNVLTPKGTKLNGQPVAEPLGLEDIWVVETPEELGRSEIDHIYISCISDNSSHSSYSSWKNVSFDTFPLIFFPHKYHQLQNWKLKLPIPRIPLEIPLETWHFHDIIPVNSVSVTSVGSDRRSSRWCREPGAVDDALEVGDPWDPWDRWRRCNV